MYGQKTNFGLVSTGITIASWWMWGVTVVLAAIAVVLMARVLFTMRPGNESRRP